MKRLMFTVLAPLVIAAIAIRHPVRFGRAFWHEVRDTFGG